jgi:hypothetical protein
LITTVYGSSSKRGGDFYLFQSTLTTARPDIAMGIVNTEPKDVLNFNI